MAAGLTLAEITISETLMKIPILAVLIVVLLSLMSGIVSLLQRLKEDDNIHNWKVYLLAHMMGAVMVGYITFFVSESYNVNDYLEAACISICSFGGSKFMDRVVDAFGDKVLKFIGAK
jgi:hypothetical protein